MKIVITGIDESRRAVVVDDASAFLLGAIDGRLDSPIMAHGTPNDVARIAAGILATVRQKFGDDAFNKVIRAARGMKTAADFSDDVLEDGASR
jgi:hypothetical protein